MKPNLMYDAIVVGGGAAGLTSAAYLSKYGYRTLLCEAGEKVGGLVSSFEYGGFTFDAGIRAFENSGIIFPMLKELGITIDFVKNPVSIGVGDRLVRLTSRESVGDYEALLSGLFPESSGDIRRITQEIKKVMQYMDVLYGIDNPLFMDFTKDREYLLKTLLPWLLKYQVNIRKAGKLNAPIQEYLRKFTDNTALIDMITQHFFKDTPSFFALSYFGVYLNYSYPVGGTGVLAQRLGQYIAEKQGEILVNTKVTQIDLASRWVKTGDGQVIGYRKLIWAADMKSLYAFTKTEGLSEGKRQQASIAAQRQRVAKHQGGDSVLTLFLGTELEGAYFEGICGAHSFYTPVKQGLSSIDREGWKTIASTESQGREALKAWLSEYLGLTTYEISCPSLRDAALAPQGKTGVIVSTLMDYRLVQRVSEEGWYGEFKEFCEERILEVLTASLFPELRGRIAHVLCSTPLTIERVTGSTQGAITGWAFSRSLPAENEFRKIMRSVATPLPHVYQAGQWVFSPSGLPISLLTGKIAADAVRRDLGQADRRRAQR